VTTADLACIILSNNKTMHKQSKDLNILLILNPKNSKANFTHECAAHLINSQSKLLNNTCILHSALQILLRLKNHAEDIWTNYHMISVSGKHVARLTLLLLLLFPWALWAAASFRSLVLTFSFRSSGRHLLRVSIRYVEENARASFARIDAADEASQHELLTSASNKI